MKGLLAASALIRSSGNAKKSQGKYRLMGSFLVNLD